MKTIEKYIEALENKDFEGLGNLFTKDGHYCDYCPNGTPQHEYHLYGRQAEFIASFGGYYVMAIASLQQLSGDGHIRRLK